MDERHERGADLDPEVAPGDHGRIRLGEDGVERIDRLGLLDLRNHARRRAGSIDQRAQISDIGRRADERERDEVDA